MLSEEEMTDMIGEAFADWHVELYQEAYDNGPKPEGTWEQQAAHAIAEKLAEGVVWETHKARMTTHKDGHKIVTIDREENISITRLWGRPLSEEDGEHVRVTVTKLEGEDADK